MVQDNRKDNQISQLKRENSRLKQKLKNYSSLLHEGNNAIIIFDLTGNIIAWDKGAEALYGWNEDEILNSNIFEIIPEDQQEKFEKFIEEVQEGGAQDIYESQRLNKSGEKLDVWFTYNMLKGSDNEPYAIATTERDITKRKETTRKLKQREQKYKSLVESLGAGLIEFNLNGKITYANPAAKNIFTSKTSTLLNKNISDLLQSDNKKIFNDYIQKLGNKEKVNFELEIKIANTNNKIISVSLTKNYSIKGNIKSYIGILEDITDIRRMEEEMIKADKMESLGLLAGGLAHDFRNILSIFMGNITLLKMKLGDDDKIKKRLKKTEQAVERAKDLTKQLKSLSTGGQIELQETEISSFIKQSVKLSLTGQKQIDFEYHADDDLPDIKIDKGQINQVISNLVINAYQAMDDKGQIQVKVEQESERSEKGFVFDNDYIKITIQDNGPGIPQEQRQNIFEPYFTTKSKGTGLGLSTARSIVRKHGGRMEVSSSVDIGTKFFIYLPISAEHPQAQQTEEVEKTEGKVLFMEGDSSIQSIARVMLAKIGFEADFVKDINIALNKIKQNRQNNEQYKAIFLNPQLPQTQNDPNIIQRIREQRPDVRIIGLFNEIKSGEDPPPEFDAVIDQPLKFNQLKSKLAGL